MQFLSLTSLLLCDIPRSSYFYKYYLWLSTKHLLYGGPRGVSRKLSIYTQNIKKKKKRIFTRYGPELSPLLQAVRGAAVGLTNHEQNKQQLPLF